MKNPIELPQASIVRLVKMGLPAGVALKRRQAGI